jgi:serine/threonine protein kinase
MSEFDIMKILGNFPFILNLHYCFQSANYLFMAIDFCSEGDFTNVKQIKNIKIMFAELILAFEYMHKNGIIYRDLKPENILLDKDGHIKLCDFNLAKKGINNLNKRAHSFCGSPLYLSPEMLSKTGVTLKSDIYQIGLVFYQLYTNKIPFSNARNIIELYDLIKKNNIDLEQLNEDIYLKDLIQKMVLKENERIYINDIKKHEYFKGINWDDVLNKKCGKIEIIRNEITNETNNANNIKVSENNFKDYEEKLNNDTKFTYNDGKISVKEMKKDLKRKMKNYIREFYYINKKIN